MDQCVKKSESKRIALELYVVQLFFSYIICYQYGSTLMSLSMTVSIHYNNKRIWVVSVHSWWYNRTPFIKALHLHTQHACYRATACSYYFWLSEFVVADNHRIIIAISFVLTNECISGILDYLKIHNVITWYHLPKYRKYVIESFCSRFIMKWQTVLM